MSENRLEILVGAVVLMISAGFLIYLLQNESIVTSSQRMNLVARFESAQGVGQGTEVKMLGVKIGNVSDIILDTEDFYANIYMNLRSDIKIPDDSSAAIVAEGLLGGNFVEIRPGGSFTFFEEDGVIVLTTAHSGVVEILTNAFLESR